MSLNNEFYAPQNYEPDIKRAYHNLSEKNSFTPHTGLNYPVYHRFCYAGDKFEINTGNLLQTIVPMNRPLLDCYELRLEYYFEPLRNLYGYMSNNSKESTVDILEHSPKWCVLLFGHNDETEISGILGTGLQNNDQFPSPFDDGGFTRIEKNSLFEHFGVPVGWQGYMNPSSYPGGNFPVSPSKYNYSSVGNVVNIEPLLAYLDICRTYHLNTQIEYANYVKGGAIFGRRNPEAFDINSIFEEVSVKDLDDLFVELRYMSKTRNFNHLITSLDGSSTGNTYRLMLYQWLRYCSQNSGGFFPVQYRPDMWRNLLSRTQSYNVRVSTSGNSFAMEELYQKNKLKKLADSVLYSGGRFKNLLRTVMGWNSDLDLDIPILKAVQKHIIDPSNITAMATTQVDDAGDPNTTNLGQKAANVDRYNSSPKTVTINCDEPGYIIVVANITPLIGYSQGFDPFILRTSHNDDWTPQMNNLSQQDIPRLLYSAIPDYDATDSATSVIPAEVTDIVGKQIAWVEERTAVGRQHGEFNEFNGDYRDMVLGRRYSHLWTSRVADHDEYHSRFNLSPYVNPLEYNDIFAISNLITPPWSLHCAFNIKALRPIGKHYKPSLE